MSDRNDVYWFGSYLHILVMTGFLVNIWRTKSCSGVSVRTQFLFALIFTTRHQDLLMIYLPVQNIILKIMYVTVTYGTVLSMLMYFPKTYERKHDKSRIDIWIVACLILGLVLSDRFDFLQVLTAFSTYLEAIAMLPQFQFITRTKRIDKSVILYIAGMAACTVLYVAYVSNDRRGPYSTYNNRIAAAAIQLLLYADFFRQVYPWLGSQNRDDGERTKLNCGCLDQIYSLLCSQKPEHVQADVESEVPHKGHLANNVSNVVLTPFTLTGVHNYKESSDLATKETIEK